MRMISLILLILVCSSVLGQVVLGQDRSGIYEIRGLETQPDGETKKKYVGILILKKVSEDNQYLAQWTSTIGQNTTGIGYARNGFLILGWSSGTIQGITEYKLEDGGTYKGRWMHSRSSKWHEEKIIFKMNLPSGDEDEEEKAKKG